MIDIEMAVYNIVVDGLIKANIKCNTKAEYVREPEIYPTVSVCEISNISYTPTQDDTTVENHALCSYQIDIYTKGVDKKFKAKQIRDIVDQALIGYKFTRMFGQALDDTDNNAAYHIVLRYQALVDNNNMVYTI